MGDEARKTAHLAGIRRNTPSERVAIARAIEEEIGKRQGQRTDLGLPDNSPEVIGKETRQP